MKINIIGPTSLGKSTLSKALSKKYNIPKIVVNKRVMISWIKQRIGEKSYNYQSNLLLFFYILRCCSC